MLLIPRSQIWTQQPPDPASVADVPWLAFALLPQGDTFVDVVSGRQGVINNSSGNGAPAVGATGRALYGPNSNFYAQSLAVPGAAFGTGDFAVGIVGSFETIAAAVVALSNDAFQAAGSNQWRMQPNYNGSSTSAGSFCFLTYGGAVVAAGANSLFANGSDYSFLGVRRGTTVELWRDGVKVASNTGTAQNVSGAETQAIGFGWGTGVSTNAGGNRYLGYGIRGTLTPEQAASLSSNPWRIFDRQDAQIIIPLAVGGGSVSLTIADSAHAHAADNLALSTDCLLSVADASHAHTADNIGLTSSTDVVIADANHAHTADNITLSLSGVADLLIADATHSHAADNIAMTSAHLLAVQDAAHAHAADSLTLDASNAVALAVVDATHTHSADNIVITSDTYLAVMNALHGHGADNVVFPSIGTDSEKIQLILDILENRQALDPATGLYTLYADDGVSVLRTAQAWEDAAGTIPFRGQVLGRLDAMQ